VRQLGSHIQLKRGNLLEAMPNHTGDLNPQVLRSFLRQVQITVEEFITFLD